MSVLVDHEITALCDEKLAQPMISPFVDTPTREVDGERVVSFGVTSAGYDARLSGRFQIFKSREDLSIGVHDPLDPLDPNGMNKYMLNDTIEAKSIILPPGGYLLGHTVEYFHIPRNVIAICVGKSTYARLGLVVNVTPLEPEWHGEVVIEMHNATHLPIRVHAHQGICQFVFHKTHDICKTSYADKGGKYQGQKGITHARL